MEAPFAPDVDHLALLVYLAAVGALVAALLLASHFLGERRSGRGRLEPFESGIVPLGFGRFRISAQFYVVAMLFVLFDMEVVFIIAWAIAFREVGWFGYGAAMVFLSILTVALIYEWRMGALDWGTKQRRPRHRADYPEPSSASGDHL
ncbi:MAG: NADH-quinone oxidoreductase subunit A [Halofilum sp. (in: g-proteobacteria)]